MLYIKKFKTANDYSSFVTNSDNNLIKPNLFYVDDTKTYVRRKKEVIPTNVIYYTTTDGKVYTPYKTTSGFNVTIKSNTYNNGIGIIEFNGTLTKINSYAFYNSNYYSDNTSKLKTITLPNSVTEIGDYAFKGCNNLIEIDLGRSITKIGYEAFSYLKKLRNIIIPNSVISIGNYAFDSCRSLTSIRIPNSVTSIGSWAFSDCTSLTSVTIGNGVTSIGSQAFYYCNSLTSITIPNRVTSIGSQAFYYCNSLTSVTIGKSVTSIGDYAFAYCHSLTSITIPNNVTYIGGSAFNGCTSLTTFYGKYASADNRCLIVNGVLNSFAIGCGLTEYVIPNSVTSIGSWAFSDCTSLTSVTIPDSVTSIGSGAFSDCKGLTSITIPDSVTSIGDNAFCFCYCLKDITIGTGVTSIGNGAFDFEGMNEGAYSLNENKHTLSEEDKNNSEEELIYSYGEDEYIEHNVYIKDLAAWCKINFGYGYDEEAISNDENEELIYSYGEGEYEEDEYIPNLGYGDAYANPLNYGGKLYLNNILVEDLVIPEGVQHISSYAFYNCSSLKTISLPSTLENIGCEAFYGCENVENVTSFAINPPKYYTEAFGALVNDISIYVPHSSLDAYKTANGWKNFASNMIPLYTPSVCTHLTITANDVNGRATNTEISYTAITNGYDMINNQNVSGITVTGKTISSEFAQNTSTTNTVQRTISFTYLGKTASTTITQGVWVNYSYTIDLNNEWRKSTGVSNPNAAEYDGVYESFSNYNIEDGDVTYATMYVDINGYNNFYLYIRSYAESSFDYVMVSQLDTDIDGNSLDYNSSLIKSHTKGYQQSGNNISNYKLVKFNNIDGGEHRITIVYRKDSSVNNGDDRGYVLIPTDQDAMHNQFGNNDAQLIEFTIYFEDYGESNTYQAEEGMTWEEWVVSDYNTDGWYYDDMDGNLISSNAFSESSYISVDMNDTIVSDETYYAYFW